MFYRGVFYGVGGREHPAATRRNEMNTENNCMRRPGGHGTTKVFNPKSWSYNREGQPVWRIFIWDANGRLNFIHSFTSLSEAQNWFEYC